jgi:hypothetical protein
MGLITTSQIPLMWVLSGRWVLPGHCTRSTPVVSLIAASSVLDIGVICRSGAATLTGGALTALWPLCRQAAGGLTAAAELHER